MAQTAIVTGGTGGLGAAVTEAFVGAGWQVVVPWIVEKELSRVRADERVALQPFPGAAGYAASKRAVLGFVDALDAEYRDDGVRVNAIIPSVIDTPANRAAMPDADFSRWVQPSAIATVVRFLCSDDASPISGGHVPVYGRA